MIEYLLGRQSSRQWNGFLSALAAELSSQMSDAELRALMQRVGARFATQRPLPPCNSVPDMQGAMSETWLGIDWGWVSLQEKNNYLAISHYCTPLMGAFGPGQGQAMGAFLEGVYQQWFHSLGSGPALCVRQATQLDHFGFIEYRLSQ